MIILNKTISSLHSQKGISRCRGKGNGATRVVLYAHHRDGRDLNVIAHLPSIGFAAFKYQARNSDFNKTPGGVRRRGKSLIKLWINGCGQAGKSMNKLLDPAKAKNVLIYP